MEQVTEYIRPELCNRMTYCIIFNFLIRFHILSRHHRETDYKRQIRLDFYCKYEYNFCGISYITKEKDRKYL